MTVKITTLGAALGAIWLGLTVGATAAGAATTGTVICAIARCASA